MTDNLHWLGHDSFRWDGSKTIYFDPWKIPKLAKKADIVLITHEHFDHCSRSDVGFVSTKETVIVTCASSARELKSITASCKKIEVISPGDTIELGNVKIVGTESYNIGKKFHPRSDKNLGFIVTMDSISVYHAGDTDMIPEMGGYRCDVALLPVSGTYVMTADEAYQAALAIKPKVVVPMHYADIVGREADARRLQDLLKGKIEVSILKKEG